MLEFIVFRATGQGATPMDGTTYLLLKGCCLRRLRCRTSRDASRKGTPDDWSAHLAHSLRRRVTLGRRNPHPARQSRGRRQFPWLTDRGQHPRAKIGANSVLIQSTFWGTRNHLVQSHRGLGQWWDARHPLDDHLGAMVGGSTCWLRQDVTS